MPVRASRIAVLAAFVLCASAFIRGQEPVAAEERFRVACGFARRGLSAEAAREFEAFLAATPQHADAAEAWYRLGVCRSELGKPAEALPAFEEALRRGGVAFKLAAEGRYRRAEALRAVGKAVDAAAAADALADESGPEHYLTAASRFLAGESWRDAGRFDRASKSYLAAAAADRSREGTHAVPSLFAAGGLAYDARKWAAAAEHFAAAAARAPEHPAAAEADYLAGDSLLRAGDAAGALPRLVAAASKTSTFADEAAFAAGRALTALGRDAEAAESFRAFLAKRPQAASRERVRLELARTALRLGRAAEAFAAAEEAASAAGDDGALRSAASETAGFAALELGRAEDALRRLDAVRRDPGEDASRRARIEFARAEAAADLERFADALVAYRAAAEAAVVAEDDALSGDARYGEAFALSRLGKAAEALAVLEAEAKDRPTHRLAADVRMAAAENRFALGRYAEAATDYDRVPPDHASAPEAAFKRAWCAYLGGDAPGARDRFTAFAAKFAGDPRAEEAAAMIALAALAAGDDAAALEAADRYRARFAGGAHLAKTERVAARVLKKRGDLRAAAERLQAAAKAPGGEKDSAGDRLLAAELAYAQGDFAGARRLYAALAERSDADGARALEGLAWCAFELGDEEGCRRAAAAGLAHPEAAVVAPGLHEANLAALRRAGKHAEAAEAAARFLELFPRHSRAPEVRFAWGAALARAERPAEALKAWALLGDGAGLARPDLFHYEAAWAARRAGDEAEAVRRFAAAAGLGKDDDLRGECLLHVATARAGAGDATGAAEALAAVRGKHRPTARYRLGFAAFERGEAETAAAALTEAAEADPNLAPEALYVTGEAWMAKGDAAKAAPPLRRVVREAPTHARAQAARRRLVEAELALGRAAEAAAIAEEFLRRDDGAERAETARAWLRLGKARAALKDHAAAGEAFTKAASLSDGEAGAEAQFRLGLARRAAGDEAQAAEAWIRLAILYGHAEWASAALFEAGASYEKLAQPERARKLYAETAEKFPASEAAKKARARSAALGG